MLRRAARRLVSRRTGMSTPPSFAAPRPRLTTRLNIFAANPHEQSGLGLYDLAIFHVDDAIGLSGKFLIMSDDDKGNATCAVQRSH
jgi:hypothetical protein